MPKKVSRKNLVKRLDNIFSQYIRLKIIGKNYNVGILCQENHIAQDGMN
jgi:hypothetical protein